MKILSQFKLLSYACSLVHRLCEYVIDSFHVRNDRNKDAPPMILQFFVFCILLNTGNVFYLTSKLASTCGGSNHLSAKRGQTVWHAPAMQLPERHGNLAAVYTPDLRHPWRVPARCPPPLARTRQVPATPGV